MLRTYVVNAASSSWPGAKIENSTQPELWYVSDEAGWVRNRNHRLHDRKFVLSYDCSNGAEAHFRFGKNPSVNGHCARMGKIQSLLLLQDRQ